MGVDSDRDDDEELELDIGPDLDDPHGLGQDGLDRDRLRDRLDPDAFDADRLNPLEGPDADALDLDATDFEPLATPSVLPRVASIITPAPLLRMSSVSMACPKCGGPVDVKSPHVVVHGGAVRVYCSAECLAERDAMPAETGSIALPPKSRRVWWWLLAGFAVAGGVTAFFLQRELSELDHLTPPAPAVSATQSAADPSPSAVNDPQKEADTALMGELMHDAWIHPLAGPTRRMPHSHNGAFGAERGGERPPECVSGHCGVDVGNVWGERVYAVHDGVVDFVNRGPNEERGGIFVRIAHRDGTLFSWYFHLAAVPRSIRPGDKIAAGTLIGLLGDTGVKHSEPHLHFALSVRTSKHQRERYLDPEPLIAIWPLWIPNGNGGGTLSTAEEPGVPVRASGGSRRKSKNAPTENTAAVPSESAPAGNEPAPPAAPAVVPEASTAGSSN